MSNHHSLNYVEFAAKDLAATKALLDSTAVHCAMALENSLK